MTKEELEKSLIFVNEERERLQRELEEEKRINEEDLKYIDELNERIEKAVEYIKQLKHSEWITFGRKILLDILNGESK